ncbi:MAG: twin-arginine translocation pathway signal [Burkholderiaceae bacterium]
MTFALTCRALLTATLAALLLGACASPPAGPAQPPIVFVHGNGETAALWTMTLWRFESNGWPRERLSAIDVPYPLARDDDAKEQPGRTSSTENMRYLAAEVDKVLATTGASQVVLMGNSRGGYSIRQYIESGGGAAKVSHAILGGTPNHGIWVDMKVRPGNEFNGAGALLTGLNAPKGPNGDEVTPGIRWLTIRSDVNDKYAQPDGVWIASKGTPTNVTFAGPELKGATNIVIPAIDHRETAYSPQAFEAAYRFITGRAPTTTAIAPQDRIVLDGKVSGLGLNNQPGGGNFANNLALVGATVEVYATEPASGERRRAAVHRKTIGADGRWGPFDARPGTPYEFVIAAPGFATTHIYRSPFPRTSDIVNLRAERLADADKAALAVVTLTRPRGYFTLPQDRISLDGAAPPGIVAGVGGAAQAKLLVKDNAMRAVAGEYNGERIVGRAWPAAENHLVLLELHR